jgi:hypothetical protein
MTEMATLLDALQRDPNILSAPATKADLLRIIEAQQQQNTLLTDHFTGMVYLTFAIVVGALLIVTVVGWIHTTILEKRIKALEAQLTAKL